MEEAEGYISELVGITGEVRSLLLEEVRSVARDNDTYLGAAMAFFGNSWVTVNMLPNEIELIKVGPELIAWVRDHISLMAVEADSAFTPSLDAPAVQPAIYPVITAAAGAGFPNVVVDPDGVRRRIDLTARYGGRYFGQLVFAPLLRRLGDPGIRLKQGKVVLENALTGDGSRKNITIPLDSEGKMVINWPPKSYDDSFRHLSYNNLVVHGLVEEQIIANLNIMDDAGYLDYYQGDYPPLELYNYALGLRDELLELAASTGTVDQDLREEYLEVRALFFDSLVELASGETKDALIEELERVISAPQLGEEMRIEYQEIRAEVEESFSALSADVDKISDIRTILAKELEGAFVIIGHTGISTTDIGVNPFEKEYMNVGTHAAVINTILQEDFLTELPMAISLAVALVITLLLALAIRTLAPLPAMLTGGGFILGTLGAGILLFVMRGWYLPMTAPLLMVFLTFLSVSVIKFLKTEGEKSFLRNAFGHYLSNDVINQLIDDPDRLNLGGEKKELTAMFTDIKGFSTISEQLDPTDLVKLLNHYLTGMSDIILDLRGTIDKYEGDAIIAFFGAPVDYDEHPWRAAMSAIRMKRMEQELNERFLADKLAPSPLQTRIGINTGQMVVGNMGTLQKMDYTIMGNAVNLAARLEGVNKQYGTWILISETTCKDLGEEFVTRKLDRVRVVGINNPVRLFELIEEPDRIDERTGEGLEIFNRALDQFEAWEWDAALKSFTQVQQLIPGDGPSLFFSERAKKFLKTPPPADWDGVFNLTLK
jgi:adenylate cyclase